MSEQPSLLYGPEHQQAIGRVVLAASSMEAVVATILARLWDPPEHAIQNVAGRPAKWQRDELRRRGDRKLPGRLRDELLAWGCPSRTGGSAEEPHRPRYLVSGGQV